MKSELINHFYSLYTLWNPSELSMRVRSYCCVTLREMRAQRIYFRSDTTRNLSLLACSRFKDGSNKAGSRFVSYNSGLSKFVLTKTDKTKIILFDKFSTFKLSLTF